MEELIAVLRYFPLDPVTNPPNPIRKADLDKIARETGAAHCAGYGHQQGPHR